MHQTILLLLHVTSTEGLNQLPKVTQLVTGEWFETMWINTTSFTNLLPIKHFLGESPLQYSCLENPMDGGAWWAVVHGVAKSWTRLSHFTLTFHFHALGKEMATQSSVLARRIPGTREPCGLPSMGSHRVGYDWSDLAAAAACHGWLPRWCQWQRTCLPMQETWEMWVWSLGREDPLGWEDSHKNPHGQKSLAVCSPRGRKESDSTEPT